MRVPDHALALLLYAALCNDNRITTREAVLIGYPDFSRAQLGNRNFMHFTSNPKTGECSWIAMPEKPVGDITKEDLEAAAKYDAGKPGTACIDEMSRPEEFWKHNNYTLQNFFFYLHVVQDNGYDRHLRVNVDTENRYDDQFIFNGETLSGDDFRGKGDARWGTGLVNSFDDQFYIELARMYKEATGITANQAWIDSELKPLLTEVYSAELAESAKKFINIPAHVDEAINNGFGENNYPVSRFQVRQAILWMIEDILAAFTSCGDFIY